MASTYLSRTFGSGNQKIFTVSAWLKFSDDDEANYIFSTGADSENRFIFLRQNSSNNSGLSVDAKTTSSQTIQVRTNRAFRDTSAWYHIVLSVDTTQATASDRVKIYVNGVQETSFAQSTYPSQNYNTEVNKAATHYVGKRNSDSTYYNGSMAHYHFIDGTAYDADTFGETDSTTGIWKPKFGPSVTYGTNGFFLKFENSGAFGTDSSGNSNTFTVNGTMTQNIDTPSNVFATWNPLAIQNPSYINTLSNGNLTASNTVTDWYTTLANFSPSKGKWYWEVKPTTLNTTCGLGIYFGQNTFTTIYPNTTTTFYCHQNGSIYMNSTTYTYMASYSVNDIIIFALDMDNGKFYMGKNGSWADGSGNSNQTFANAVSLTTTSSTSFPTDKDVFPMTSLRNANANINFGNGFFGTTAVSSAQNPDDGIGIFEYDVPAGYRALCTKSINAEEYS